ncbi:MAG: N5-glutamine methyltransferase family protein [Planctomycetota bacterium]|jgi:release factor glutamine methyltransferase
MDDWTTQKLLNWITQYLTERGIDSPRLSAELLLGDALNMSRIELYTNFDKIIAKPQLDELHKLVKRAGANEPVAYLVGKTEFYSMQLKVTRDCLIPRPETELLVERAIEFLRTRSGPQLVCDLCTGCGCIAVAIAKNFPDAKIIATDISDAALNIAAGNVEKYQLNDRVSLLCGDLFEPLVPQLGDYEPKSALLAGADGLDVYRRICEKAPQFLKPDAALMMEIGYAQGQAVTELLQQCNCYKEINIEKDFHNNDRIVLSKK